MKSSHSSFFIAAALALGAQAAFADTAGSIGDLSGMLVVRGSNGISKVLAARSSVEEGDTLSTQKDSFASIRFKDGAELTLLPESILVVTRYVYDERHQETDLVRLGLVQGGFRSTMGAVAKRSAGATEIATPLGMLKGGASMTVALPKEQK